MSTVLLLPNVWRIEIVLEMKSVQDGSGTLPAPESLSEIYLFQPIVISIDANILLRIITKTK